MDNEINNLQIGNEIYSIADKQARQNIEAVDTIVRENTANINKQATSIRNIETHQNQQDSTITQTSKKATKNILDIERLRMHKIPVMFRTLFKQRVSRAPDTTYSWTFSMCIQTLEKTNKFWLGFVNTESPNVSAYLKAEMLSNGTMNILQEMRRVSDEHVNDSTYYTIDGKEYICIATGKNYIRLVKDNSFNTITISTPTFSVNGITHKIINGKDCLLISDGTKLHIVYLDSSFNLHIVDQKPLYRTDQINQGIHFNDSLDLLMTCESNSTSINFVAIESGKVIYNAPLTNCQSELEQVFYYNNKLYAVWNIGNPSNNNGKQAFITQLAENSTFTRGGYLNGFNPVVPLSIDGAYTIPHSNDNVKVSFRDGLMYMPNKTTSVVKSLARCFSHIMVKWIAQKEGTTAKGVFTSLIATQDFFKGEDLDIWASGTHITPEGYLRVYSFRCNPPIGGQGDSYFNFTRAMGYELDTNTGQGKRMDKCIIQIVDVYGINQTNNYLLNSPK